MDQELLFSYFRGETTPQEEERILAWIEASDANRREFRQAHVLFAGLALYAPDAASSRATGSGRRWIGRRILRYSVRVAAAVVLVLGAAYFGKAYYHRSLSEQQTRISVPAGQRMQLTLADGTCVQLNSGTTLEYPVVFAREARRVRLSGEAMFEVAPDSEHPFVVETFASDIRVLGTKFNVRAYKGENCWVNLAEGSVEVSTEDGRRHVTMKPDDQVCYTTDHRLLVESGVDASASLAWMSGGLKLHGLTLREIANILERKYSVEIHVSPDLAGELFNCHFDSTITLQEALKLLSESGRFKYREKGNEIYFYNQ